jgi:hypothetical protein
MSIPALQDVPNRARWLRPRTEWWWAALVAVAVIALLAIAPLTRGGPFVDHVRVTNAGATQVEVDVAPPGDDAWMGLGTARPNETSVFDEVYDIGDEWVVRFWTPEHDAQVRITRAQLERDGWKIEVPATLVAQLR